MAATAALTATLLTPTAALAAELRADNLARVVNINGTPDPESNRFDSVVNGLIQQDHRVAADVPKQGATLESNLDPRVESWFSRQIKGSVGTTYTFTARYTIIEGTYTTIAQILATDLTPATPSDKYVPQVFVTATRDTYQGQPRVRLYEDNPENSGEAPFFTLTGASTFNLKIVTNGNYAEIYVNNTYKYTTTWSGFDHVNVRYGAYHHGAGLDKAANIRVIDAKLVY